MNIANRLLSLFSFNFEQKYGKQQISKLQLLSVGSLVMVAFFLVQTIMFFLRSNYLEGIITLAGGFVIFTSFFITIKRVGIKSYNYFIAALPGLTILTLLWIGQVRAAGILSLSVFPVFAIGLLGNNRGAIYSIIFFALSLIGLFIPLSINAYALSMALNIKLFYALLYISILALSYLYETISSRSLHEMEKLMLDEKNARKLKEEFIANLSHQIRTPLNNIMVVASILEKLTTDDKQKDLIDTIHASTNNLVNVVNSMVEISNVDIKERGSINLVFNFHNTINSTIKLFSTQESGQSAFSLKIDESIPENLIGDPVRIKQIFLNLIESVLKNKSGSKANINIKVVKVKEVNDELELLVEIKSNRPIMLPLNEGHNLFVTSETSLTSASTQMYIDLLELSITQKLIESNGGKLSIVLTSEDATFSFPYALSKIATKKEAPQIKPSDDAILADREITSAPSIELENANVLLVEDNLINQKIVVLSLKKLVKNIEIANNGKEALDKFGTSKFDIILMDIQMPIMNGIVATKKIREVEASSSSHTPIIAITANALLGDKEECLAAGMDDYISKPFQIEVLIQKMKNLLKPS